MSDPLPTNSPIAQALFDLGRRQSVDYSALQQTLKSQMEVNKSLQKKLDESNANIEKQKFAITASESNIRETYKAYESLTGKQLYDELKAYQEANPHGMAIDCFFDLLSGAVGMR